MNFKQRLDEYRPKAVNDESPALPEETPASNYYALDLMRPLPPCLDLRLADGTHRALPYAYFTEINFDSETGIEILTNSKRVAITGRNLTKLFDQLISFRVRYIQANVGADLNEDGLFVKDIIVEQAER